jgi:hypothetical protein
MLTKIYTGQDAYCIVYKNEDTGDHFIDAICPGQVWHSSCVRMTEEETRQFESDHSSADTLAKDICRNLEDYESRAIDGAIAAKWRSQH